MKILVDTSVARSFAVVGWTDHLVSLSGGCITVAEGVHGVQPGDRSELRGIRDALVVRAETAGLWSGTASRAVAAAHGLEQLLSLDPARLDVLRPRATEFAFAARLRSRRPEDRTWRKELGARFRRLDLGEAVTIAIAHNRSLAFASDDSDALVLWQALTSSAGKRTIDLLRLLVEGGEADEADARQVYELLRTDDLHRLGGPDWPVVTTATAAPAGAPEVSVAPQP